MENEKFSEIINSGFKSLEFREMVQWLVNEISTLAELDEKVIRLILVHSITNYIDL